MTIIIEISAVLFDVFLIAAIYMVKVKNGKPCLFYITCLFYIKNGGDFYGFPC